MIMGKFLTDGLRILFLCLYALGILVLFIKFILARPREKAVEKRGKRGQVLLFAFLSPSVPGDDAEIPHKDFSS